MRNWVAEGVERARRKAEGRENVGECDQPAKSARIVLDLPVAASWAEVDAPLGGSDEDNGEGCNGANWDDVSCYFDHLAEEAAKTGHSMDGLRVIELSLPKWLKPPPGWKSSMPDWMALPDWRVCVPSGVS